jgi:hypothetical protein
VSETVLPTTPVQALGQRARSLVRGVFPRERRMNVVQLIAQRVKEA